MTKYFYYWLPGLLLLLVGCVPSSTDFEPMAPEGPIQVTRVTATPLVETAVATPSVPETPTIWATPTLSFESATATAAMATALYPTLVWNDLSPVPTRTPYATNIPTRTPSATQDMYPNSVVAGYVYRENEQSRLRLGYATEPIQGLVLDLAVEDDAVATDLVSIPTGDTLVILQGTYFTGDAPYLLVNQVELANLPYDENTPLTETHTFPFPRFSFQIPAGWFVTTDNSSDIPSARITNWAIELASWRPGQDYLDLTEFDVRIQVEPDASVADYLQRGFGDFLETELVRVEDVVMNGRSLTRVSVQDLGDDTVHYILDIGGRLVSLNARVHNAPFIERLLATVSE
ncbi:MAG: hypothetical protein KC434_15460 [Anaerolineales bacterium]|nr:hypothetical protein [Anaerolineales bacterium]